MRGEEFFVKNLANLSEIYYGGIRVPRHSDWVRIPIFALVKYADAIYDDYNNKLILINGNINKYVSWSRGENTVYAIRQKLIDKICSLHWSKIMKIISDGIYDDIDFLTDIKETIHIDAVKKKCNERIQMLISKEREDND